MITRLEEFHISIDVDLLSFDDATILLSKLPADEIHPILFGKLLRLGGYRIESVILWELCSVQLAVLVFQSPFLFFVSFEQEGHSDRFTLPFRIERGVFNNLLVIPIVTVLIDERLLGQSLISIPSLENVSITLNCRLINLRAARELGIVLQRLPVHQIECYGVLVSGICRPVMCYRLAEVERLLQILVFEPSDESVPCGGHGGCGEDCSVRDRCGPADLRHGT